jgi:hypothetical protein
MDVCLKVGKDLATDLYQELFLILCEKDDNCIEEKYNSTYWNGYIIKIIFNQYYSKYTNFAKKYINPIGLYDIENIEIKDEEYDINSDVMLLCIDKVINELDWYHNKIWHLYTNGDESLNIVSFNARSINRGTGISRHEIWRVIKSIKEKVNQLYIEKYGKHID